jgi:Fe/S biogenesis protein NfuA
MSDTKNTPRINVTEAARQKFGEVTSAEGREDHGLRVIVHRGGSPQPEFALNFVPPDEDTSGDVTVDAGGLRVHLAPSSARWLDDATIDFIDTLTESGFKVDAPNSGIPKPSGPVADAVQKVLNEKVNPAIAAHGGNISLVAIEDATAYLKFGGGCQGCGMVNVTLKQGVEKTLFEDVPEITRVMDVTDHASGQNPYYQPAK